MVLNYRAPLTIAPPPEKRMEQVPALTRLKIAVDHNGCWNWLGHLTECGYPMGRIFGKLRLIHRGIYELTVAPLERGYDAHHKCQNARCVNPAHIEPMLQGPHRILEMKRPERMAQINALGAFHKEKMKLKTHCKKEHEYTAENTYINSKGRRECVICRLAWQAKYRAKKNL